MSSRGDIKRIKSHLGREKDMSGESRQVFGRAVVRLPWYSPIRFRNMVIMAAFISSLVFAKPFYDLYQGFRRGIRLEGERKKFLKQLDSEEAEAAANPPTA